MTLRQYLIIMGVGAAAAWASTAMIVLMTSPAVASPALIAFLYASIFLALLGTFSVAGFSLRAFLLRHKVEPSRQVAVSFRQAILLSLMASVALFLSSRGWLNWWSALVMVAVVTGLELLLISLKVKRG